MTTNRTASTAAKPSGIGVLKSSTVQAHIVPGVHRLPGQGNSVAIETARGVILVDAGPGGKVTAMSMQRLREITDRPLSHIVYSHGHGGYNGGVNDWLEAARQRGEPRPLIVAQERVPARYRRYLETAGLQQHLNGLQFRAPAPRPEPGGLVMPDLGFGERLVIDGGDRRVELLAAPSETDDTLAVWLPAERFLYGSAAVIRSIPNVGTPLRTLRDPLRWAETLERLHALRPAVVLGEFGSPVTDAQAIDDLLLLPVAGLRWLRAEVVRHMNQGLGVDEIVHAIDLPPAIFGHHFMRPIYGCSEYVIRDIWRSENGWWDRNPTNLHTAPPAVVAADLRDALIGSADDAQQVIARARTLADAGQTQLALHVIDLLALLPDDTPGQAEARRLKADLLDQRARQVAPVVSRNLYRSLAEGLRGQPLGSTRADDPTDGFSWD